MSPLFSSKITRDDVRRMEKRRDVKGLIKAMNYLHDYDVNCLGVGALGNVGDGQAVPAICAAVLNPIQGQQFKVLAAQSLKQLNDPRACEALASLLRGDNMPFEARLVNQTMLQNQKKIAAEAFERLGAPAIEWLIPLLDRYDSRDLASQALAAIGPIVVEPLIAALRQANPKAASSDGSVAAIRVLNKIGDRRVIPHLITLLEFNYAVREAAAEALGDMNATEAVEALIDALQNHRSPACAQALGRLGDRRAVAPLVLAAHNRADRELQEPAISALIRIDPARAFDELLALLSKHSPIAAEYLGLLGDDRAILPLISALGKGGDELKEAAAKSLGKIGDARAVPDLIRLIETYDWNYDSFSGVKATAARALVGLYQSGKLDQTTKKLILKQRAQIEEHHYDYQNSITSSTCANDHSDTHDDYTRGVPFPF